MSFPLFSSSLCGGAGCFSGHGVDVVDPAVSTNKKEQQILRVFPFSFSILFQNISQCDPPDGAVQGANPGGPVIGEPVAADDCSGEKKRFSPHYSFKVEKLHLSVLKHMIWQ